MDTVVCTKPFESELEEMIAHCRSLDARMCWPGAVPSWSTPTTLYYKVSMRLKAATMTDIDLTENLLPQEEIGGGVVFRTTQRCVWPDGVAEADTEYRFIRGTPNTLQFSYRYKPPSTKLVRTKDLATFHGAMERVVTRYLEALTAAPVRTLGA